MSEDLKWSNYDFTKIPFDDIVQVGQRTLLYRDILLLVGSLGDSVTTDVATAGPTQEATEKTIDQQNSVSKQLKK